MTDVNMVIWGREFDLKVEYRVYQGKTINDAQKDAFAQFIQWDSAIDQALSKVISHIECNYRDSIHEKITNIFRYVIPRTIYIPKQREGATVALLCDFRFDCEHGLALVFQNGGLSEIGDQDIIL